MKAKIIRLLIIFGMLFTLDSTVVYAEIPAAAAIVMVGPATCPAAGCAAGQKLDFKVDFDLGDYSPSLSPNVQVCIYTPIVWSATLFSVAEMGDITGASYIPGISYCSAEITPEGYNLLGGASATILANQFGDGLTFGFRLGGSALSTGSVLVRVLEQTSASGWIRSSQVFSTVRVVPGSNTVFAANDAAACGTNSPCYINSLENLANGLGTGLKDAIDARITPTSITILGNYSIKDHAVIVPYAHTIQGINGSVLTYSGTNCAEPMLKLTGGVTLRNLIIRDGNCLLTSRDLVVVEGTSNVLIETTTLTGGKDAIQLTSTNSSNLRFQFNQVTGNSGYAIWLATNNVGTLEASANNIYQNRSGFQVECNNHGRVEHNYWGAGVSGTAAANNCQVTDAKRLGAPALVNTSGAGIVGGKLTVTDNQKTYFLNSIGFQRNGGNDFDIYVVNHGAGSSLNVPFTSSSPTNLNPCSNYWDVFLAENSVLPTGTTLSVSLKYDLTSGCVATISSTRYCSQPDPVDMSILPLYWYDPSTYPTSMEWRTTGATGQNTSCSITDDEIKVIITGEFHPNLADLVFLPFVIGLPGQPTAIEIQSYGVEQNVRAGWTIGLIWLLAAIWGIWKRGKGGLHE